MIFLYNLLLFIFFPIYFLVFYPLSFIKRKWKKGFFTKLGLYKNSQKVENPFVFHCVSVGETLATIPLIKKFIEGVSDNVLLTVTTQTGYKVGKDKIGTLVKEITFFPLDFPFSVLNFFRGYKPKALVISETEIWPNIIFFSKVFKIPIIFVNGRISDRSFNRYLKFRWFFKAFLSYPCFIMQSEAYKNRIIEMGADEKKVFVSGNIKYDIPYKDPYSREDFGLNHKDIVIIAGSTHAGEEKIILDAFNKLKLDYKNLKLIVAPRHPERFKEVEDIVRGYGFKPTKRSKKEYIEDVFLLDVVGELFPIYSLCDIAFVGGSLVNIGGHNILEPAYFSKPVLFGKFMSNFIDIRDKFLEKEAGLQVDEGNLYEYMKRLIEDEELRLRIGRRAKEVVEENRGSLEKTLKLIEEIIKNA